MAQSTEDMIEQSERIINPPPEIRSILDKTAKWISSKGGKELENKIREKESTNPRFSFLNPGDPYHAYYRQRLDYFKENTDEQSLESGKRNISDLDSSEVSLSADNIEETKKHRKKAKKLEPKRPKEYQFILEAANLSAQDLDIIKLTALFVARNGKQFMTKLAQKESRNYQFDFLRPSHSLFPLFNNLIDQYTKILLPGRPLLGLLEQNAKDKQSVLQRCKTRAEWEAYQEGIRKQLAEKEERERLEYLSIDWHDFVVVQTIDFTDADSSINLPHPTSIKALQSVSLTQRQAMVSQTVQTVQDEEGDDMEME